MVGVRAGGGEAWLIPADDRDMARCPRLDPYYRARLKTHHARLLTQLNITVGDQSAQAGPMS